MGGEQQSRPRARPGLRPLGLCVDNGRERRHRLARPGIRDCGQPGTRGRIVDVERPSGPRPPRPADQQAGGYCVEDLADLGFVEPHWALQT
jgi:hypothetical protein